MGFARVSGLRAISTTCLRASASRMGDGPDVTVTHVPLAIDGQQRRTEPAAILPAGRLPWRLCKRIKLARRNCHSYPHVGIFHALHCQKWFNVILWSGKMGWATWIRSITLAAGAVDSFPLRLLPWRQAGCFFSSSPIRPEQWHPWLWYIFW